MSATLNELVRKQIQAEAPGFDTEFQRDLYVNRTIHELSNAELLERISEALDSIIRELPTRLGI